MNPSNLTSSTRKCRINLMYLVLAFWGLSLGYTHACPVFSSPPINPALSEDTARQTWPCSLTGHDRTVDHGGHGCRLDCSKKHQSTVLLANHNLNIVDRLRTFSARGSLFNIADAFQSVFERSVVPHSFRHTTKTNIYSTFALIHSIRTIVILV